MRKVIVSNFVSLDGFMARPNGELDWFVVNEEFFDYANDLIKKVDTILYGRVTYEGMARYWPTVTSPDDIMAERINNLPKLVFTKTLKSVSWGDYNTVRLAKDSLGDEVTKLKQQAGKDIVIYGSGNIASQLTQLGLIDEYQLVVCPVVLGKGLPQFRNIDPSIKLKLLETTPFKSGSILLKYAPAA